MSSIPVPICCASASAADRSTVRDQPFREALRNDVLHLLPDEFIAAVSELLLRLNIQQNDLPALVHHHHRIRSRLQQPAVPALHLRQMLFRSLAHADVADRRRHQDSFGAFQRAQHDLDGKLAAILAPPGELDPGADLLRQRVCRGSRTVGDQPFREALRNDVLHLLPDEFIAAVSELLLRLNIQQNDLPALVHHHHRIRSRFQQPAVPALHLRQMLFRSLAHADVADRRRHQDSFGAFQRAQHDLDRKLAAILAPPDELDPGADLLRQRVCRGSQIVGDQPFREALRNDVLDLLADQFVAAVSELLLRLDIQQNDLAALVHHHHGIGSRLQQPAVLRLRLPKTGAGGGLSYDTRQHLTHFDVVNPCHHGHESANGVHMVSLTKRTNWRAAMAAASAHLIWLPKSRTLGGKDPEQGTGKNAADFCKCEQIVEESLRGANGLTARWFRRSGRRVAN